MSNPKFSDTEASSLADISERLRPEYEASDAMWIGSPFAWIKRLIKGIRVEIKFSTLWSDNKIYKFQQIRDQDYRYCFCLGVSPFAVHAWFIPKTELMKPRAGLTHQHGGTKGTDTLWLSFSPDQPPSWLTPFGGTLTQVEALIRAAA